MAIRQERELKKASFVLKPPVKGKGGDLKKDKAAKTEQKDKKKKDKNDKKDKKDKAKHDKPDKTEPKAKVKPTAKGKGKAKK